MITGRWTIPLDVLARQVGLELHAAARQITIDVFNSIKVRSPVLTGRFRANWNVSYNSPVLTTSLSTSSTRIDGQISKVRTLPVGGIVYISNGLPYGEKLENGYSRKAPSGMVRITAIEFPDYVRRVRRA